MNGVSELERVRLALERIVQARVKAWAAADWAAKLRAGGKPTRLDETFGPYSGIQGSAGYEYAVASGMNYTAERGGEPGLHHLRTDEQDPPEGRSNLYSDVVIEDLTTDPRWPEVLRLTGLDDTDDLRALVRTHVFGYRRLRHDHWSATPPKDIADALPKDGSAPDEQEESNG